VIGQSLLLRHMSLQYCTVRMRVHFRRALKQLAETLEADRQRDRESDRRPQRIASAHPVPHRQYTLGGNVEGLGGALGIGADRVQALAAPQPVAQDAAVEQEIGRASCRDRGWMT